MRYAGQRARHFARGFLVWCGRSDNQRSIARPPAQRSRCLLRSRELVPGDMLDDVKPGQDRHHELHAFMLRERVEISGGRPFASFGAAAR